MIEMTAQIEPHKMKKERTGSLSQEEHGIATLRREMPYKVKCPECDSKFYRKVFENKLREQIRQEEGLIEQLENDYDIAYWNCPKCETAVDFSQRGVQA